MSANTSATPHEVASQGLRRLADFRLIPRIDTYPVVVSFAQTVIGKLVLLALFGLGLAYSGLAWLPLVPCLALMTFIPARRRLLVTLSTLVFTFVVPWREFPKPLFAVALFALVLTVAALLFWSAARWPHSLFGRRPVFFLLCGFSLLVVIASYLPKGTTSFTLVWNFSFAFSMYIWFVCYALLDRSTPGFDPFVLQLGSFKPFWGSTNTPFPKGAAYLRRIEARDAAQLAVTQLKGLKLLAWSIVIMLFARVFDFCIYSYLHIPRFQDALALSANRTPPPWSMCWASLVAGFFGGIFSLSIFGHRIIAICRMAGFNALRNTYRPLSSRTIAEFFNRYYFYFKELLVDVFFYPVFLRYFKKNRKLRLVAAIFAAAGFGNAFYHFARDLGLIERLGLGRALLGYQVYVFYTIALATAISVSQLRHRKPPEPGLIRGQLWPSLLVVLFYCLLDVFGSTERNFTLIEHFRFFGHLFYLNF